MKLEFEAMTDEELTVLHKKVTTEYKLRNQKTYYRFENPVSNEIMWCVESKLGAYLKCAEFKAQLKRLKKTQLQRNESPEIYSYPKNAVKPYLKAYELEEFFEQDPKGKAAQPRTLESRPSKLCGTVFA
ncbi:hypothetical protein ACSTIN_12835 [Vibrio parahaemolyticus]